MITLDTLIQGLGLTLRQGDAGSPVVDLADDSRRVAAGSLFIARSGPSESGESYIDAALERGATAILTRSDASVALPAGVAHVTASAVDQALTGRLAERFFGEPSKKLTLLGVTGTSGKTTTAYLIQHLLGRLGIPCGLIGTIILDDGKQRRPAELTTPGALDFSRLLAAMVAHGCRAAVAEVSSHALHQGRVAALNFDAGVLTNLTGDHLDYHGDMDSYAAAKAILFEQLGEQAWAIVNADDRYAGRMVERCRARVVATSVRDGGGKPSGAGAADPAALAATATATIHESTPMHTRATFAGPWGSVDVKLPLVGAHNVANTLQAVAAVDAVSSGLTRVLHKALETAPQVPGRLERVAPIASDNQPDIPAVLVDYAHKTDALENVLRALRPLTLPGGRLICVFGCGGDRDKTKRPQMAAAACRLADRIVITSDNPRTEDPAAIIDDVLKGVPAEMMADVGGLKVDGSEPSAMSHPTSPIVVEADRARAIELAVMAADARDTVLIAGKGHEDYQIIGKTKRHFDDREHAAAALSAWVASHRAECEV